MPAANVKPVTRHVRIASDLAEMLSLQSLATGSTSSQILDAIAREPLTAWQKSNTNLVKKLKKTRKG